MLCHHVKWSLVLTSELNCFKPVAQLGEKIAYPFLLFVHSVVWIPDDVLCHVFTLMLVGFIDVDEVMAAEFLEFLVEIIDEKIVHPLHLPKGRQESADAEVAVVLLDPFCVLP